MITLKDYALEKKISYEAVRKQVKRYREELRDHVIVDGRQQFLDDVAVAFLDEKRMKNPIIVEQNEKKEQIEDFQIIHNNLLIKIAEQADKISELSEWKSEQALAIAMASHQQILLEEKTKKVESLQSELEKANRRIEELQREKENAIKNIEQELAEEKCKKLTLKERILGKRM